MAEATECGIRVGPAGWSYEDWKGIVYPRPVPKGFHPLDLLCTLFDTIEVNSSFYRPIEPRNAKLWAGKADVNPRFLFTVKLWERFTHQRDTWPEASELRRFNAGLAPLLDARRLGAVLAQFPWSFRRTPENRQWLARLADAFTACPLAVELRHASWNEPAVIEGFTQRGIAFCNVDQPLFGDSLPATEHVTASPGYVRLHGRNAQTWFREDATRDERYDYLYSEGELRPWLDRIRRMKERVNALYVVTNNHYRGQAVVNALEIQEAITGRQSIVPQGLMQEYPQLAGRHTDLGTTG